MSTLDFDSWYEMLLQLFDCRKLGLDLIVRDNQGDVVCPDKCSVMELFNHHIQANERIEHDSVSSYVPVLPIRLQKHSAQGTCQEEICYVFWELPLRVYSW